MRGGWTAFAPLLFVLPVTGANPTPTPDLNVLRSALVGPPDSTWVEQSRASDTLEGPFDATFYVDTEWQNQSDRDSIRKEMLSDGFRGGYGRTFYRKSPETWIIEDVKAFPDGGRALTNWHWWLDNFHDPNDTANNVDTPSIPYSFGERFLIDTWHGVDIYFQKGNYVFTVTVGTYSDYMPDVAATQAVAAYNFAPGRNLLPAETAAPPAAVAARGPILPTSMLVGAIVVGLIIVVSLVGVGVFFIVLATRPRPKYFWDGTAWRPEQRP